MSLFRPLAMAFAAAAVIVPGAAPAQDSGMPAWSSQWDGGAGEPAPPAGAAPVAVAPATSSTMLRAAPKAPTPSEPVGEPVTAAATRLLEESGLIVRQSEMGESLLLIDRQARMAEGIQSLLQVLGPNAEIEVAPGRWQSFSHTPAAMRLQVEIEQLNQELEQARSGGSGSSTLSAGSSQTASGLPALGMADTGFRASEPERPAAEGAAPSRVFGRARVSTVTNLALREVYGRDGAFTAVVQQGRERIHLRAGAELGSGLTVIEVGPDYIVIEGGGSSSRLGIRG